LLGPFSTSSSASCSQEEISSQQQQHQHQLITPSPSSSSDCSCSGLANRSSVFSLDSAGLGAIDTPLDYTSERIINSISSSPIVPPGEAEHTRREIERIQKDRILRPQPTDRNDEQSLELGGALQGQAPLQHPKTDVILQGLNDDDDDDDDDRLEELPFEDEESGEDNVDVKGYRDDNSDSDEECLRNGRKGTKKNRVVTKKSPPSTANKVTKLRLLSSTTTTKQQRRQAKPPPSTFTYNNRQAVKRCRQRVKSFAEVLKRREEELQEENVRLREERSALHDAKLSLKTELLRHAGCGGLISEYIVHAAEQL